MSDASTEETQNHIYTGNLKPSKDRRGHVELSIFMHTNLLRSMTSLYVLNFDEPWKKYDVIYLSMITSYEQAEARKFFAWKLRKKVQC